MTGSVNVTLVSIRELDNNSNPIPGNILTPAKLMMQSYSPLPQPYSVSLSPNVSAGSCNQYKTVVSVNQSAPNTIINVTVCYTTTNGLIVFGTESEAVYVGQAVVFVNVAQWPWGSGVVLEVNLTIMVAPGRSVTIQPVMNAVPARLGLGVSDAYTDFSRMVVIDGNVASQPAGYPMLMSTSSGANVTLRIPVFVNSGTCYEVIEPGNTVMPRGGTGTVSKAVRTVPAHVWSVMIVGTLILAASLHF
jgi:hypothetical protein